MRIVIITVFAALGPIALVMGQMEPRIDTATWYDATRGRSVPVAIHTPENGREEELIPVILSHGYDENRPGTYLHYSYLAECLVRYGCFVLSIQHDLPGDAPLAMRGDLRKLRLPAWERGVGNIAFALGELSRLYPSLDLSRTVLIGHSNGGDLSVRFAAQHPHQVRTLITLDNRRCPLPRTGDFRVLSLRSNDAPADEGVLPTGEEAAAIGMSIVHLADTRHNEMSDRANPAQRERICSLVTAFIVADGSR